MTDVDAQYWCKPAEVTLENADTTTFCDLQLLLRCNQLFTADSIRMTVTFFTPDSITYAERLTFPVDHDRRASALRNTIEVPYRQHIILQHSGSYRISLTPYMPQHGIEAVGLNRTKSK